MERPPRIDCAVGKILEGEDRTPYNADGHWKPQQNCDYNVFIPAVLGSTWTAPDGSEGTILINHTLEEQSASVRLRRPASGPARLTLCDGSVSTIRIKDGAFDIKLKPLTGAVLIREKEKGE
jgi:hypothetical protein